jgi:hypothetical protein
MEEIINSFPDYSQEQITDFIRMDLYYRQYYLLKWCNECMGYTPVINDHCGNLSVHSEEYHKVMKKEQKIGKYPRNLEHYIQLMKKVETGGSI